MGRQHEVVGSLGDWSSLGSLAWWNEIATIQDIHHVPAYVPSKESLKTSWDVFFIVASNRLATDDPEFWP